jgi:hypothetical protein
MAMGVNRDASHYCRAPGSDLAVRHGGGAPWDCAGSAVRRTAMSGAGPPGRSLRRNRFGRGRSSCRSPPGRDNPRIETAALTQRLHGPSRRRQVDERHDCRDTDPACVPSTVWGTASSLTAKFRSAPCLPLDTGKLLPRHPPPRQPAAVVPGAITPRHTPLSTHKFRALSHASNPGLATSHQSVRQCAPERRGS